MCSNILYVQEMKERFCLFGSNIQKSFHDADIQSQKLKMDFPWVQAAHRAEFRWNRTFATQQGAMRLSPRGGRGRPEGPDSLDAHDASPPLLPLPPSNPLFSLTRDWQRLTLSHRVSFMESGVSREGRTLGYPLVGRPDTKVQSQIPTQSGETQDYFRADGEAGGELALLQPAAGSLTPRHLFLS